MTLNPRFIELTQLVDSRSPCSLAAIWDGAPNEIQVFISDKGPYLMKLGMLVSGLEFISASLPSVAMGKVKKEPCYQNTLITPEQPEFSTNTELLSLIEIMSTNVIFLGVLDGVGHTLYNGDAFVALGMVNLIKNEILKQLPAKALEFDYETIDEELTPLEKLGVTTLKQYQYMKAAGL